jgi:hypothetical protein
MPELTHLTGIVFKSADKVLHREMPEGEAKRLPDGFSKPEDGDWVCMSAEVPPEDEAGGDVVRVAGLSTVRHTAKSPIKLLGQHMRGTSDGSPAIIGRMEEFKLGKKSWKGKQIPAMFGRFSWAKDGEGKTTDLAAKYKSLWEGGYLDSVSIGFRPIKSRSLNAEKPWDGYEFIESELVELSVVTIPANPAATALKAIAEAFETKEQKVQPPEGSAELKTFDPSETFAPTLKRFEKLLDDMECSLAVAKPNEANQAGDTGNSQEQAIDAEAVLSYLKSRL